MIIGILSDTHDRALATEAGVRALREAGAEILIHCGDVGAAPILDLLTGLPTIFVWGNNDWDRGPLGKYARELGLTCGDDLHRFTLEGKDIAVAHGDDDRMIRRLLDEQLLDYLFTGHTHVAHDRRQGRTRWINPGALHRARPKTVATLDLASDRLKVIKVEA